MERRQGRTYEVCKRKKHKQEEAMQDIDYYGDDSMSEFDYDFRPKSDSESDNSKSVGGQVKEASKVIATFYEHKKAMSNVNCAIETLGRVVVTFNKTKRGTVTKIGFGKLLYASEKSLPRHLSYWISTRLDVKNKMLVAVDGQQIRLNAIQVHWVLGLPKGNKALPIKVVDKALKDHLYDKYITPMGRNTTGIYRSTLVQVVEAPLVDEGEFKKVFVMLVLNILCSTTCHRVIKKQMRLFVLADKAEKYDWCTVVLDELLHALGSFSKRFYAKGWAPCLGGCTYFLSNDSSRSYDVGGESESTSSSESTRSSEPSRPYVPFSSPISCSPLQVVFPLNYNVPSGSVPVAGAFACVVEPSGGRSNPSTFHPYLRGGLHCLTCCVCGCVLLVMHNWQLRANLLADAPRSPFPHALPLREFSWLDDISDVHRFDHYVERNSTLVDTSGCSSNSISVNACQPWYVDEVVPLGDSTFYLDDKADGLVFAP
uniref:Uncharacterized protein n=1 Tax=Chenopodium quinoa TaxID=63459 RepID=A0A803LVX9_CHEQI